MKASHSVNTNAYRIDMPLNNVNTTLYE